MVSVGCSGASEKPHGGLGRPDGEAGESGGANIDGGMNGSSGNGGVNNFDGGDGNTIPGCKPKTCKELGKNCGPVADGCGGIAECGDCAEGKVCGIGEHNVCTAPADLCKPATKAEACKGLECGITGNGCGDVIDCGDCPSGTFCGLKKAFQCDVPDPTSATSCPAKIESCASVGAECGQIANGCGGLIDCAAELGPCAVDEICGIKKPNQCDAPPVCTPQSAAKACPGKCGLVANGCEPTATNSGLIDCDSDPTYKCPSGESCGAGGTPNQCGDTSMGTCVAVSKSTACGAAACGIASDGCSGMYTCGTCNVDELCDSGVCKPKCVKTAMATACAGKECGKVSDGCGSTYTCGTCDVTETCGQQTPFQCDLTPPPACVPLSAAAACAGKECGIVYDGCGTAAANKIDCATVSGGCGSGEFCGLKTPFQCDAPTPPACTPAGSCAALNWACGTAFDSCGNQYDCAAEGRTCNPTTETCIGGITGPTVCQTGSGGPGGGGTCTVCGSIPACTGMPQVTKISGRVITPGNATGDTANQVGVPNAFVYILTKDDETLLPAISSGIPKDGNGVWQTACDRCDDQNLGPVLTSATTDSTGAFTLSANVPVNTEIVLVVKIGKWRRAQKITVPANKACTTYALDKEYTRLPRTRTDGLAVNIPRTAISTGKVDAMECVFYKMGLAQSEFAQPGATGTAAQRIHMYASEDSSNGSPARGAVMAAGAGGYTSDAALYGSEDRMNSYDLVVFDCEGKAYEEGAADDTRVRSYVNRGGRMFASHWSYTWLHDNAGVNYATATAINTRLDTSANWTSDNGAPSTGTGHISLNRTLANSSKISTFAAWLLNESAVTNNNGDYTFTITDPRDLATSLNTGSEEWVYRETGSATAASCSCNSFSCFFSNCPSKTTQATCTGSCTWNPAAPAPTTVQQYSFNTPFGAPNANICGRVAYSAFHVAPAGANADFTDDVFPAHCSGNLTPQEKVLLYMLFDLASCVTTGGTPTPPACTPLDQSACTGKCGTMSNGCGGTLSCGTCGAGMICGSNNLCTPASCTPLDQSACNGKCGTIANGCGGSLTCGDCPTGQICGLYTPNECSPTCMPSNMSTACSGKCGFVSDGCGGVHQCSDCASGLTCVNNTCMPGSCNPAVACPSGLECGVISDGCSGTVNCGTCTLPEVCGAVSPNMCDQPLCQALTCNDLGADCGLIGDGCGGSKDCGDCDPGQVCGLGGPNKCGGCKAKSCSDLGAECGQIGDGCGGSKDCGVCPSGKTCGANAPNKCGTGGICHGQSCTDVGAECGLIGDGCGGIVDCGKCISTQVCGIESPNKCNAPPTCTKQSCTELGAECGKIGDGCGALLDCGQCGPNKMCGVRTPNKCTGVE